MPTNLPMSYVSTRKNSSRQKGLGWKAAVLGLTAAVVGPYAFLNNLPDRRDYKACMTSPVKTITIDPYKARLWDIAVEVSKNQYLINPIQDCIMARNGLEKSYPLPRELKVPVLPEKK